MLRCNRKMHSPDMFLELTLEFQRCLCNNPPGFVSACTRRYGNLETQGILWGPSWALIRLLAWWLLWALTGPLAREMRKNLSFFGKLTSLVWFAFEESVLFTTCVWRLVNCVPSTGCCMFCHQMPQIRTPLAKDVSPGENPELYTFSGEVARQPELLYRTIHTTNGHRRSINL